MARLPRLCVPGWPHLLTQTGHNRQAVFNDEADYALFLALLSESARASSVAIHAYALLQNEVRLLAMPGASDSLSRMMQAIGRRYGASFNRRHGHVGTLWEGRFRAVPIEPERHLLECMRYVEESSAEDASQSMESVWSSADHHRGLRTDPLINDHSVYWALGNTPFERQAAYRDIEKCVLTAEQKKSIVNAARSGWPLGSPEFFAALAGKTERRLTPLRRGRPRKDGFAPRFDPNY